MTVVRHRDGGVRMPSVFPAELALVTFTSAMYTPSQTNGVNVQKAESFRCTLVMAKLRQCCGLTRKGRANWWARTWARLAGSVV